MTSKYRLTLGDVLRPAGLAPGDLLVIRHSYGGGGLDRMRGTTPEYLLEYTRRQSPEPGRIPAAPPRFWLAFIAERGLHCRLAAVYENHGEVVSERTADNRFFDLSPVGLVEPLVGRLVIDWTSGARNWAVRGDTAGGLPVVEIADPELIEFPGYDNVLVTFAELREVVSEPKYRRWREPLASVQGIYLITDTSTGKQYVGKADGKETIWQRWGAYAQTGHGGDVGLRALAEVDADHPQKYQFSLLRVFGAQTPEDEVNRAESHFKRALLSREFGLNEN